MPFTIPWALVLKYGLPLLFVLFITYKVITHFVGVGEDKVQTEWDAAEQAYTLQMDQLKKLIEAKEAIHRNRTNAITSRLADAETTHASELAALRGSYDLSLRRSDDRSKIYERQSQAGATERANLASHASQLDRSLVEGRQVVGELRSTVVQRDRQLVELGEQLQADRRLIASATTADENADTEAAPQP